MDQDYAYPLWKNESPDPEVYKCGYGSNNNITCDGKLGLEDGPGLGQGHGVPFDAHRVEYVLKALCSISKREKLCKIL